MAGNRVEPNDVETIAVIGAGLAGLVNVASLLDAAKKTGKKFKIEIFDKRDLAVLDRRQKVIISRLKLLEEPDELTWVKFCKSLFDPGSTINLEDNQPSAHLNKRQTFLKKLLRQAEIAENEEDFIENFSIKDVQEALLEHIKDPANQLDNVEIDWHTGATITDVEIADKKIYIKDKTNSEKDFPFDTMIICEGSNREVIKIIQRNIKVLGLDMQPFHYSAFDLQPGKHHSGVRLKFKKLSEMTDQSYSSYKDFIDSNATKDVSFRENIVNKLKKLGWDPKYNLDLPLYVLDGNDALYSPRNENDQARFFIASEIPESMFKTVKEEGKREQIIAWAKLIAAYRYGIPEDYFEFDSQGETSTRKLNATVFTSHIQHSDSPVRIAPNEGAEFVVNGDAFMDNLYFTGVSSTKALQQAAVTTECIINHPKNSPERFKALEKVCEQHKEVMQNFLKKIRDLKYANSGPSNQAVDGTAQSGPIFQNAELYKKYLNLADKPAKFFYSKQLYDDEIIQEYHNFYADFKKSIHDKSFEFATDGINSLYNLLALGKTIKDRNINKVNNKMFNNYQLFLSNVKEAIHRQDFSYIENGVSYFYDLLDHEKTTKLLSKLRYGPQIRAEERALQDRWESLLKQPQQPKATPRADFPKLFGQKNNYTLFSHLYDQAQTEIKKRSQEESSQPQEESSRTQEELYFDIALNIIKSPVVQARLEETKKSLLGYNDDTYLDASKNFTAAMIDKFLSDSDKFTEENITNLKKAAGMNYSPALIELGKHYSNEGKITDAFTCFLNAASQGASSAFVELTNLLANNEIGKLNLFHAKMFLDMGLSMTNIYQLSTHRDIDRKLNDLTQRLNTERHSDNVFVAANARLDLIISAEYDQFLMTDPRTDLLKNLSKQFHDAVLNYPNPFGFLKSLEVILEHTLKQLKETETTEPSIFSKQLKGLHSWTQLSLEKLQVTPEKSDTFAPHL